METLRTLFARLGTPGAVRNAEHALLARWAEDRAIADLTAHLAAREGFVAAPAA
jgi:hypothetical protein